MSMNADGDDSPQTAVESDSVIVPERTASESDVADGVEYLLDPATVTVVRLTALIWVGSILTPIWFGALMVALFASSSLIVTAGILALPAAATAFLVFAATWWPKVRYRFIKYRTDENGFTIKRGVLWRGVTSIPKARVQHTDVVQGPIQRRYGLGKLVIHTAGTQDASVSLSGLPHDKALAIRDFLIEGGDNDGV